MAALPSPGALPFRILDLICQQVYIAERRQDPAAISPVYVHATQQLYYGSIVPSSWISPPAGLPLLSASAKPRVSLTTLLCKIFLCLGMAHVVLIQQWHTPQN